MKTIRIQGAKTHNLKNIDLELPRNQLIVITGLSGSGKSSLAFDTLYAEGQRRYVESLSTYARQFLSMMEKPDVDLIEGLSPAISIEQKTVSHNPRSTVGTITEIYDYLRLLYARLGQPICPTHKSKLNAQTISQMVDSVMALQPECRIALLAPMVDNRKGEQLQLLEKLRSQGFIRAKINGEMVEIDRPITLDPKKKHDISVVIDRLKVRPGIEQRLAESFETALNLTDGLATIDFIDEADTPERVFSAKFSCPQCGYSVKILEPRLFSFNNPNGACPDCDGLGMRRYFDPNKVVIDEGLSIADGAIRGWDKQSTYYFQLMKGLAAHYNFPLDQPWASLTDAIKQHILYGSGRTPIKYTYSTQRGIPRRRNKPFEGVIPSMERRYRDTESENIRTDLAKFITHSICPSCEGARLCESARHVLVGDCTLPQITQLSIDDALEHFNHLKFNKQQQAIAQSILKEILGRLRFLSNVGLNYLMLSRTAETLSGGETQRIRLASQIGSGLVGVLYILDEPTIGLHQRDSKRLIETLTTLRDLGNTVIVVEHDLDTIKAADHLVDIGPKAGINGGHVVAQGSLQTIQAATQSLTGQYLCGKRSITLPKKRQTYDPQKVIRLRGADCNNLQHVDVNIPLGLMTCVTGVSGSGKSSLINDTLTPIVSIKLNHASTVSPGPYTSIGGLDALDKAVTIDQSPIGRTPRSNPATYTGMFTIIRELFANTPEARARGYLPGRFSFNVQGGRCEACQGGGLIRVEMHFLADVYVTCDVCQGKRYNRETLDIRYKNQNIYDVLALTIDQAMDFFDAVPMIKRKLQTLVDVGLGYLTLGQSATTLSGGEAQRIKLSKELSKRATGRTLYILDEPSTGLHFHDIKHLLSVLHRLRDSGNTIVVIEHNLDIIKTADWIIDLGPEGGANGGQVLAMGTPEQIANSKISYTGQYLRQLLTEQ